MKLLKCITLLLLCFFINGCTLTNETMANDCIYVLNNYDSLTQEDLSNLVFRLHIVANSNSSIDQEVKIQIRDAIIKNFSPMFENVSGLKEAKTLIDENIEEIEAVANEILIENGFKYSAKAVVGDFDFPKKDYGDFSLPKGEYSALKIDLGEASGDNWWCVLYPPLCFVDINIDQSSPSNGKLNVKWRFLEFLK